MPEALRPGQRRARYHARVCPPRDDDDPDGEGEDEAALDGGEPVVLPIEEQIDLHPFAPADIPSVVEEYLREAAARGFRRVRLVHGRGKGVQRGIVRALLARHPAVVDFADAPPVEGGWGATIVNLRG
jgi:dsDNA-specific endonuclease/ATPase MutS2